MVRTLERLVEWRGKPDAIRVDNGPEYLSQVLTALPLFRCQAQGVRLHYIQPAQNAYIEQSHLPAPGSYVFESLREVYSPSIQRGTPP